MGVKLKFRNVALIIAALFALSSVIYGFMSRERFSTENKAQRPVKIGEWLGREIYLANGVYYWKYGNSFIVFPVDPRLLDSISSPSSQTIRDHFLNAQKVYVVLDVNNSELVKLGYVELGRYLSNLWFEPIFASSAPLPNSTYPVVNPQNESIYMIYVTKGNNSIEISGKKVTVSGNSSEYVTAACEKLGLMLVGVI